MQWYPFHPPNTNLPYTIGKLGKAAAIPMTTTLIGSSGNFVDYLKMGVTPVEKKCWRGIKQVKALWRASSSAHEF